MCSAGISGAVKTKPCSDKFTLIRQSIGLVRAVINCPFGSVITKRRSKLKPKSSTQLFDKEIPAADFIG
jgi:hypothetical protein